MFLAAGRVEGNENPPEAKPGLLDGVKTEAQA